jgi:hypothetical protein
MTEVLDDSKYAKGTGIFSVYEKVDFPADMKKRSQALLDLGNETLLENDFIILGFVPYPGLGKVGAGEILKFSWILSESHRLLMYDPKTKRLIDELYTCSPEKDGRLMLEKTNKLIGKPRKSVQMNEIVSKEMALQEEPDKDSLEVMLTKALNKDDQKPVIESACRYDPQGYTYIHQSAKHFAGLHSYPGTLKSAHLSLIGTGNSIVSVLEDVEEVVYKRKKTEPTISVKIVAEDF